MNINLNLGGIAINKAEGGVTTKLTSGADTQGQVIDDHKNPEQRHDLVDGDYQVIVHVIEARELKPVDMENGTADPIVVASLTFPSSLIPARQNTLRKVNTLNPVFDHTMIFRQESVPAEEARMAVLKLSVKDSNIVSRDTVVGEYDFNLSAIYNRKNHQYVNQWCALADPSGADVNPTGYLKVNITVLIGDDEMATVVEKDVQDEKFGVMNGVTAFRDVLMAPYVIQGRHSICCEITRGEGFTPLDFSQFIGLGGVDPYVQLQFGNMTPTVSSYVPGNREPVWQQQLEVPVLWPTMVDTITVSVWDHDNMNTDDAIGAIKFSYKKLSSTPPNMIGPPLLDLLPNWFNLYGSPPEAWTQGVGAYATAFAMNHGGTMGTFFRGRILMRIWCRLGGPGSDAERRSYDLPIDGTVTTVYKDVVTDTKSDDTRKFVAETKETGRFDPLELGEIFMKEIMETHYNLRMDVYEVADMDVANTGPLFGTPVSIKVRVGSVEVETKKQKVAEGRALFNESLDMTGEKELHYPEIKKKPGYEDSMFPDVFIYLMRDGKHIAYIRHKGYDLFEASKKKISKKDFVPRWVPFIEEPCHDFFGPGEIPGYVLCSIILGKPDDVEKAGRGGKLIQPIEKKYQLRFHLYMAKFLPAKDENGLSDPYVLLKYYGKTLKSSVKAETCNPTWYETITDFVAVPEPLELAPPITCMVYDEDKFSKDDLIGRFHIELNKEILAGGATPATPKWHNLVFEKPGDVSGKVLASVTLVPEEKADSAPLPQLKPDTVQATVEVTAIGLRDMKPVPLLGSLGDKLGFDMGLPLMSPFVEFDLGDAETRKATKESANPSPMSPNFLERYEIKMLLPKDPLFCPTMTLRVRDTKSVGGFAIGQPLVATGTIAIDKMLPWAPGFKPAESPLIEMAKKYMAEGADAQSAYKKGTAGFFSSAALAGKKMMDKIGDFMDDGEMDTPKYMYGRKTIDDEFENTLKYPNPIYEWGLFRGCDGFLSAETMCGKFKGYVRVTQDGVDGDMLPMDLSEVFVRKPLMVRVYLLKAYNLPPMDLNGSCDSYPVVEMGETKFDDKEALIEAHLNPNYYSSYEIPASLPGNGDLKISIYDYDKIGLNDLVGSTQIDIENRWFNQEWRSYALKPVERRTLHLPGSSMSQGKVELWVDVYTPNEAKTLPMIDIKPPAPEEFELRMIIWETKDIPMKTKDGESKIDMKVNCNFIGYESIQSEGGSGAMNNRWDYAISYTELVGNMQKQLDKAGHLAQDKLIQYRNQLGVAANPGYDKETDVHWWVKDGIGRFNYRMVWPCKYNHDMIEDKQMRMQITVYDHDAFDKDDLLGETQIDLQPLLKLAFRYRERNTLLRIGQPWRLVDKVSNWKSTLSINKDGKKTGEIVISLEVVGHMVAMIKPAGQGREDPNQHPTLPEPLRRGWDEPPPMYQPALCGCCSGNQGNMS